MGANWYKGEQTNYVSRISHIVLTIIITAVITFLLTIIVEPELQLLFLVLILETCVAGFLIIFGIGLCKDYKRVMMAERVPRDAILKKESKVVTFDDKTLKNKTAKAVTLRRLYNGMKKKMYRFYNIPIFSPVYVPRLKDIKLLVDGKTARKANAYCIDTPKRKTISFDVPLNLEAGKTKDFEIKYRTKAYEHAIKGKTDYIELIVPRVTDELEFWVLLQGRMKDEYEVVSCEKGLSSFEIFDASKERMETTEHYFIKKGITPKFQEDRTNWLIRNPKVGYHYRLYFKLLKKRK